MKIILCGGRTGGHIWPLIRLKNYFCKMNSNFEFLYIGLKDSLEEAICNQNHISFLALEQFSSKISWHNFKIIKEDIQKSTEIIKKYKPNLVISTGGFVSFPVLYAARKKKVKYYLIEENSVMGRCNYFFYRKCQKCFFNFEIKHFLPNEKNIYCSNPCIYYDYDYFEYPLNKDYKYILFIGGSRGSSVINEQAIKLSKIVPKKFKIILVAGKDYEKYKPEEGEQLKVYKSVNNLFNLMVNVDFIVSRGGSCSIFEALKANKFLMIIPSEKVKGNHQLKNAMQVAKQNAAIVMREKSVNEKNLFRIIYYLKNDEKLVKEMQENQLKFLKNDGVKTIYKEIMGENHGKIYSRKSIR